MEGLTRGIGLAAAALMFAAVMLPEVAAVRYTVGDGWMGGWKPQLNFTVWAQGKHFYNGDWLYFVYDRYQMSVLEVNETAYGNCTSDDPLHDWSGGVGRDLVQLNVTKTYYFISGKGFCFNGMKLKINVENPPPPPSSSPVKSGSQSNLMSTFRARIFVPALFAFAAV